MPHLISAGYQKSKPEMKPKDSNNKTDEVYYDYHMEHIPQKFLNKAKVELSETPEIRRSRIEDVKKLIRNEGSMKVEWFTDKDILMYLRSRKFDAKKTFSSMKKMFCFFKKHRNYFDSIDQKVIDEILKIGLIERLPRRDSEGRIIFAFRLGFWDPSKITDKELFHCGVLLALCSLDEPMTQINGGKIIADFKCNPFKYIRYVTPFYVLFWYQFLLECMPVRAKAGHVMNPSMITKMIMTLVKSVLSEKFKKRIFFHDTSDDLLLHVQHNVVPKEFGGTLPEEEQKETKSTLSKTLVWPDYVAAILEHIKSTE